MNSPLRVLVSFVVRKILAPTRGVRVFELGLLVLAGVVLLGSNCLPPLCPPWCPPAPPASSRAIAPSEYLAKRPEIVSAYSPGASMLNSSQRIWVPHCVLAAALATIGFRES